ncbi:hypothetical protein [Ulvibacter antarcticus]|uniref:LPP20 lipoprotein n=1 Tax=Ulvibacter antarcticus TaxID=442714 RepID=A0A3L9Z6H4_9FLAO|nr:hypothetical protein [Ulvibacter antarcticus]RMA65875.1 hypothetical protein BXY75_0289 [Ulvibacter antarcticus]
MKLFYGYLILIVALVFSCGSPSEEVETTNQLEKSSSIYGDNTFVFPTLSVNAKTYITNWGAFEDFQKEAEGINGSTVEDLRVKSDRLLSRIDSLTKKVPDTLQNQPIVSRVMIAKTRGSLLRQEVFKPRIDSAKLQNDIFELNVATKNLILQINEKFQKDDIDFERKDDEKKEIEKQKRFLDSVYKSELQDKNSN